MKIYELFGSPNTPPGQQNILNIPDISQQHPIAGAINGITANNTANMNPLNANSTPITLPPDINQKLAKGSTITAPVGPNKLQTQLKVSNVGTDKDKSVTLTNPRTPGAPGQTYTYADLARYIANTENK